MSASLDNLARRAVIFRTARAFFEAQGYLEVETPLMTEEPLPEANIEAVKTESGYLITSPEVHMKPLMARGAEKIFQICKCFRRHEHGARHREEFTMLEWYRKDATYLDLQEDVRKLFLAIAEALGQSTVSYGGHAIDLTKPWETIAIREAYLKYAGHEPPEEDFQFDEEMSRLIEPNLGLHVPCFLSDYPAKYCPMSAPCPQNPLLGQRCELYLGGLELANGCTELSDYEKQMQNIEAEQQRRKELNMRPYPFPESFAAGMKGFPNAAGMAMGLDRLCMLFCSAKDISEVLPF